MNKIINVTIIFLLFLLAGLAVNSIWMIYSGQNLPVESPVKSIDDTKLSELLILDSSSVSEETLKSNGQLLIGPGEKMNLPKKEPEGISTLEEVTSQQVQDVEVHREPAKIDSKPDDQFAIAEKSIELEKTQSTYLNKNKPLMKRDVEPVVAPLSNKEIELESKNSSIAQNNHERLTEIQLVNEIKKDEKKESQNEAILPILEELIIADSEERVVEKEIVQESTRNIVEIKQKSIEKATVTKGTARYTVDENSVHVGHIKFYEEIDAPRFSLIEDNSQVFSVDEFSGELSFREIVDYEAPNGFAGTNIYVAKVAVESESKRIIQPISVMIENTNDNMPTLDAPTKINVLSGVELVTKVSVSDKDGDVITTRISHDPSQLFRLDEKTGVLSFSETPDEAVPYLIEVEASDGLHKTKQKIKINIIDSESEAPVFVSDDHIQIKENKDFFHYVSAVNNLKNGLRYSISYDSSKFFYIDPVSGLLSFSGSTDFEDSFNLRRDNRFWLELEATNGLHSSKQILLVEFENLNDNRPSFSDVEKIVAMTSEEKIVALSASDLDNDQLQYAISSGDTLGLFEIEANSGVVKFSRTAAEKLDFKFDTEIKLGVTVTDGKHAVEKKIAIQLVHPLLIEDVEISDSDLRYCVVKEEKIYTYEIESLNCSGMDIKSLVGLDAFSMLKILNLSGNEIRDISQLRDLRNLEELNLNDNFVRNIEDLSQLTRLSVLELALNSIDDIVAIANLKRLKHLDLSENRKLLHIDQLANLSELFYLDISENIRIKSFAVLAQLKRLSFVGLAHSPIESLMVLQSHSELHTIRLQSQQVKALQPLKTLEQLKSIAVDNWEIVNAA